MKIPLISLLRKAGIPSDVSIYLSDQAMPDSCESTHVIFVLMDHLGDPEMIFLPPTDRPIGRMEKFIRLTERHPDISFLVLHNCFNMPEDRANLRFVYWVPDWVISPRNDYRLLDPVDTKCPSSAKIWISLNNNRRMHRYLTSMYLLGIDLERTGYLTLDPHTIQEHQSWQTWLSWWKYNERNEIFSVEDSFEILAKGFDKIKRNQGFVGKTYTVQTTPSNNTENFDRYLRHLYNQSLVEIVNTTIWYPDHGACICEKYIHTIYGKNLPIIIGAKNTVKTIRDLGFDVFDHVIDHSYDNIDDPVKRLITALETNKKLLADFDYVSRCWQACESAMRKNIDLAKHAEHTCHERLIEIIKQQVLPHITSG